MGKKKGREGADFCTPREKLLYPPPRHGIPWLYALVCSPPSPRDVISFSPPLEILWNKGPPLFCRHLPAFVLTSSVCAVRYKWRSEGKFSSRSPSSTLFQTGSLCSLSDWIPSSPYSPISNSTSLEQGWDSSCSHYASQLLRGFLGFELSSALTWQSYLVHCTITPAFSVLSSGTHFTNLCFYHPIPGTLLLARNPRSFA